MPQRHQDSKNYKDFIINKLHFMKLSALVASWLKMSFRRRLNFDHADSGR